MHSRSDQQLGLTSQTQNHRHTRRVHESHTKAHLLSDASVVHSYRTPCTRISVLNFVHCATAAHVPMHAPMLIIHWARAWCSTCNKFHPLWQRLLCWCYCDAVAGQLRVRLCIPSCTLPAACWLGIVVRIVLGAAIVAVVAAVVAAVARVRAADVAGRRAAAATAGAAVITAAVGVTTAVPAPFAASSLAGLAGGCCPGRSCSLLPLGCVRLRFRI